MQLQYQEGFNDYNNWDFCHIHKLKNNKDADLFYGFNVKDFLI